MRYLWLLLLLPSLAYSQGIKTQSMTARDSIKVGGGSAITFMAIYIDTLKATKDSVDFTISGMTTTGHATATFGTGAIFHPFLIPRSGKVTVKSTGDEQYDFLVFLTVLEK